MQPAITDKYLYDEILNLKNKFNCSTFIETGTWNGTTISELTKHFDNLKTIEINLEKYIEAKQRNSQNKNVELYCGNSSDILPSILSKKNKYMFFLDAHWGDYWPLLDELKIIASFELTPVILIHDFFVPDMNGKPKFGYDSYHGQPLDFNYVQKDIENIYGKQYKNYCLQSTDINAGTGVFLPTNTEG